MTDKDSRKAEIILKGNKISDETIIDTALDDSVYNKLFIILWEEFKNNKNKEEILKHLRAIKELLILRENQSGIQKC